MLSIENEERVVAYNGNEESSENAITKNSIPIIPNLKKLALCRESK
jgi:hypothetical protein